MILLSNPVVSWITLGSINEDRKPDNVQGGGLDESAEFFAVSL